MSTVSLDVIRKALLREIPVLDWTYPDHKPPYRIVRDESGSVFCDAYVTFRFGATGEHSGFNVPKVLTSKYPADFDLVDVPSHDAVWWFGDVVLGDNGEVLDGGMVGEVLCYDIAAMVRRQNGQVEEFRDILSVAVMDFIYL